MILGANAPMILGTSSPMILGTNANHLQDAYSNNTLSSIYVYPGIESITVLCCQVKDIHKIALFVLP